MAPFLNRQVVIVIVVIIPAELEHRLVWLPFTLPFTFPCIIEPTPALELTLCIRGKLSNSAKVDVNDANGEVEEAGGVMVMCEYEQQWPGRLYEGATGEC
ncbi:hypothetical protein CVT25_004591 [Psilocybe cyanescens]|uniref:Uncharacterized protein n=1 Tax=Psilocybe cyanescens TaxID=93625 RepID=A0A409XWG0_PSICY|nr:hypothetical protein CVT25_004591 [Psilocybe cyanescens]